MAEEKILVLTFDEYPDDEVRVLLSPVPLSAYHAVIEAYKLAITQALADDVIAMCDVFAPLLRAWTFPEPPTREGMNARDPNLLIGIVGEWIRGVRMAPAPLAQRSSGGAPSPADSVGEPPPS